VVFTEARDSEWQWHQLGHMQVCTLLQTDNHVSLPPLSFLQARCPSCRPTNSVKAVRVRRKKITVILFTEKSYAIIKTSFARLQHLQTTKWISKYEYDIIF